jgi:hypothetical protein
MEVQVMEVEHRSENKTLFLAHPGKQSPHLGEPGSKGMGRTEYLYPLWKKPGDVKPLVYSLPFHPSSLESPLGDSQVFLLWDGLSVEECLESWFLQHPTLAELPTIVCWYLWTERNKALFNNETISTLLWFSSP